MCNSHKNEKLYEIKKRVLIENKKLVNNGLVIQSFGNASQRFEGQLIIKPSGIDLKKAIPEDMVVVDLISEEYEGDKKPSSDTPTHIELYKAFPKIGGIVHSHSLYATAWAQSKKSIPCLGTTHADYWNGEILLTRNLTKKEINGEYEKETGKVIIEKILESNPNDHPGILVSGHGPFTWGSSIEKAIKHAELLEYIAYLSFLSISINSKVEPISKNLIQKHFMRKHGPNAYYGQKIK